MITEIYQLPKDSKAERYLNGWSYMDCFTLTLPYSLRLSPQECSSIFMYRWPFWIRMLFSLRYLLAGMLRLKNEKKSEIEQLNTFNSTFREGEKLSFFDIALSDTSEIVLLAKDSHLDACLSFHLKHESASESSVFSATTLVKFHNRTGRVYFFLIKPFHKLIMRAQLSTIRKYIMN